MMKLPNDTEINANAEFIWQIMNLFIRRASLMKHIINESRNTLSFALKSFNSKNIGEILVHQQIIFILKK